MLGYLQIYLTMIMVLVEHFLNDEGRRYFPEWIRYTAKVLKEYPGFISIQQISDVQMEERSLLILRFQNLELLQQWARSNAHDLAIQKLIQFRREKQRSQIFSFDPTNLSKI